MKKTTKLKQLLQNKSTEFILEAHNGISAKIVEEAGFSGIWASGLTLSGSMGTRDCNEMSWSDILNIVWKMADCTSIPILLDGDTGYGDFNNARYIANKFEQVGVAGICFEDKLFPKRNSFAKGEEQELCSISEFCAKIKAIKDSQIDSDFCMIARTEAFITGGNTDSALDRANAYYEAGTDAILVHSCAKDASQIEDFMKSWHNKCPIVIIPTTYYTIPTEVLENMGISMIIWANHMLRVSIRAMQKAAATIYKGKNVREINDDIANVLEIFRLQNMDELYSAEKKYLGR